MAKFRFILSIDKEQAMNLPWSHIKAKLKTLFLSELGGCKSHIDDAKIAQGSKDEDYDVEVTSL